jgi:hypothetical protein
MAGRDLVRRVYAGDPREGELPAAGGQFHTGGGVKIPYVLRASFDEPDTDEGVATVRSLIANANGELMWDAARGRLCEVEFRTWVRFTHPGQTPPVPVERPADEQPGKGQWSFASPLTGVVYKIDAHDSHYRRFEQDVRKPGRVYAANPRPNELPTGDLRAFDAGGQKLQYVSRVEFLKSEDSGEALVTVFVVGPDGFPMADARKGEPVSATYSTWVQMCHKDSPPPVRKNVRLFLNPDGIVAVDVDNNETQFGH